MFKSVRVYRGAEPPANSDHRMLAADIFLNTYRAPRRPARTCLDFTPLAQNSELADKYSVTISNAFAALGHISQEPESAWEQVRDTIVTTAKAVVPVWRSKHRPWLTPETLDIIDQKRDARLTGKRDEHRRLKGIYKAKAKADLDEFYNALADEAETGFRQNNLRPPFRAIKRLKGRQDNDNALTTPVARLDGCICSTAEEVAKRWTEHHESTLNQSAATLCSELNDLAASATPDTSIAEDATTLEEVIRAVRHLRNGRSAGSDEIAPELLKYDEAQSVRLFTTSSQSFGRLARFQQNGKRV